MGRISLGMSISLTQQRCACRLGFSPTPSHYVPIIAHTLHRREILARTATQSTGSTVEINPVVDLSIENVAYEVRR
jgi:hypothetical protein